MLCFRSLTFFPDSGVLSRTFRHLPRALLRLLFPEGQLHTCDELVAGKLTYILVLGKQLLYDGKGLSAVSRKKKDSLPQNSLDDKVQDSVSFTVPIGQMKSHECDSGLDFHNRPGQTSSGLGQHRFMAHSTRLYNYSTTPRGGMPRTK